MLRVEWDISDAVEKLGATRDRLDDLRPIWRALLPYLRKATERTFATEGGRIGAKWAPLTQPYAARKAATFPGQPILRATDAMFRSFTIPGATDAIEEDEAQSLAYGSQDKKARYHQDGTPRMSQRKILDVTEADRRQAKRLARAYLTNQGTLSGFEVI